MTTTRNDRQSFETIMEKAFEELSDKARDLGYIYIFKIEFYPHATNKHPNYGADYKVVGNGYKLRE